MLTRDAYLMSPFEQEPGMEYFLGICKPTGEQWGWHDTSLLSPILDFAAVAPGQPGPWSTYQPHTDLAFELMVIPEPGTTALMVIGSGLLLLVFGCRARRK
jgi:hypothetical protein